MQLDRRRQRRRHEPRQHLNTPARDDQAGRATRDGQHETFADQLTDHAAPILDEARAELLGPNAGKFQLKDYVELGRSYVAALGQVVDNSKVVNIPLNGRSSFRLVLFMLGVVGFLSANGQFGDVAVNT